MWRDSFLATLPLVHQACFPLVWILRAVENCIDNDRLWLDLIEDGVRKSADEGTMVIEKHHREKAQLSTPAAQGLTS
jgi:hypothetical protein